MLRPLLLCFLLLAVLLPADGQILTPNEQILKRLDQLEKQNAELLSEIKALRETLLKPDGTAGTAGPKGASATPESETLAERQDISERRIEELAQTKVEASQRFPVTLTGTVLFNAFLNGKYGGGNQDPTVAALAPGFRSSGASFRQTALGLKFTGPKTLFGGTVSGSVYMDFFGGTSFSLNHLFRLRLATVQLAWPSTTIAVGQDKPIISRREPNSLAQVGVSPLTGAGNPWLWQPQTRIEQRIRLTSKTDIQAEAGIFQTSEGVYNGIQAEPARPAFETRVNFRHQFGDERAIQVAPVFHTSTTHFQSVSVPSRLYGVDWLVKPLSRVEMTGLLFRGKNFANTGALGGLRVNAQQSVIPIRGTGGWAQVHLQATPELSFNFYGGQQDNTDRDLQSGDIGKNQYYAGNVMYLLAPNVISAFEFGQNRTNYLGQGTRLNNHYDLALAYLF